MKEKNKEKKFTGTDLGIIFSIIGIIASIILIVLNFVNSFLYILRYFHFYFSIILAIKKHLFQC